MRIFYDIDTQNDFMNANGALYVPGAEEIKGKLFLLTGFAISNYIPILGSVDRHFGTEDYRERELELQKWGGPFPEHCMDGTEGQLKIYETVVWSISKNEYDTGIYLENQLKDTSKINKDLAGYANLLNLPRNRNAPPHTQGIYFEKQSYDVFTNPAFEEFLDLLRVDEAVVYGVATDYCVRAAVLGMQDKGVQCYVVEDAIRGVAPNTTKEYLEKMLTAGAKFVTTKQVLEERL